MKSKAQQAAWVSTVKVERGFCMRDTRAAMKWGGHKDDPQIVNDEVEQVRSGKSQAKGFLVVSCNSGKSGVLRTAKPANH